MQFHSSEISEIWYVSFFWLIWDILSLGITLFELLSFLGNWKVISFDFGFLFHLRSLIHFTLYYAMFLNYSSLSNIIQCSNLLVLKILWLYLTLGLILTEQEGVSYETTFISGTLNTTKMCQCDFFFLTFRINIH